MTETGYGAGEAAIAALCANVSGFSTATVTRANWSALNSGAANQYQIIHQASQPARVFEGHNLVTEKNATRVQVWQRYTTDGTSYTNLIAAVEAVLKKIDQYPRLGDTSGYVVDSNAIIEGPVQEMWRKGGGPLWLRQDVLVRWTGQRVITFLD
jgi:hypothetical protein